MEFNARYALISAFALAVLAAVFGFVYWLNNSGGFTQRTEYHISFSVPVSGLARGSNVLFNGLKVGEVTGLSLSAERPDEFFATIAVNADTPMREDTKVGVDFQGLTGAANISLTGGSATAAKIETMPGKIAELKADPASSRSWTTNAGRVLGRLDEMLSGDNNRLDTILAGLEKMVGGDSEAEAGLYDLSLPSTFDLPESNDNWQLAISEPTVVLSLNTNKLLQIMPDNSWVPYGNAKWTDNLPNLVQSKLIQGFENAGFADRVVRPSDVLDPENRLAIDIRTFHVRNGDTPIGVIDLFARILDVDGAIIASKRFQSESELIGTGEPEVMQGMGSLFSITATELISWTASQL